MLQRCMNDVVTTLWKCCPTSRPQNNVSTTLTQRRVPAGWVTRKISCPNFIPVFDSTARRKFAWIALGTSCESSLYEGLHDRITSQNNIDLYENETIGIVLDSSRNGSNDSPNSPDERPQKSLHDNTNEEAKKSLSEAFAQMRSYIDRNDIDHAFKASLSLQIV